MPSPGKSWLPPLTDRWLSCRYTGRISATLELFCALEPFSTSPLLTGPAGWRHIKQSQHAGCHPSWRKGTLKCDYDGLSWQRTAGPRRESALGDRRTFQLLLFVFVVARLADVHSDGAARDGRPVEVYAEADVVAVGGKLPAHFLGLWHRGYVDGHDVAAVHCDHAVLLCPELRLQLLHRRRRPGRRGL